MPFPVAVGAPKEVKTLKDWDWWDPILAQKTRKDGAPGVFSCK